MVEVALFEVLFSHRPVSHVHVSEPQARQPQAVAVVLRVGWVYVLVSSQKVQLEQPRSK